MKHETPAWALIFLMIGALIFMGVSWAREEQDHDARIKSLERVIDAQKIEAAAITDRAIYLEEWSSIETLASHYGGEHNGRMTASGKIFDENELTAASPWLPFGKKVRVTSVETGLSCVVKITDRGPIPKLGRGIDLSTAAASLIGLTRPGVGKVILSPPIWRKK